VLEKRWREQRNIESHGIMHEDTLFRMGVLSQSVYNRFLAMRAKSSNLSVLPHWLGLESIQTLRDIVWELKKHLPKPQKLPLKVNAEAVLDDDELLEEGEWDKEDVEEIQGKFNQLVTM
jgi:hypothetical protein